MKSEECLQKSKRRSTVTIDRRTIDNLRKDIKQYIDLGDFVTAAFWIEKIFALNPSNPSDTYTYAYCLFKLKRYKDATLLILRTGTHKTNKMCRYLLAKCYAVTGNSAEAVNIINEERNMKEPVNRVLLGFKSSEDTKKKDKTVDGASKSRKKNKKSDVKIGVKREYNSGNETSEELIPVMTDRHTRNTRIVSAMWFLKGTVYQSFNNMNLAVYCYKRSLDISEHCYDAFQMLIDSNMLTTKQLLEVVRLLRPENNGKHFTRVIYQLMLQLTTCSTIGTYVDAQMKKNGRKDAGKHGKQLLPCLNKKLYLNEDILFARAQYLYTNFKYEECCNIVKRLCAKDPYKKPVVGLYVGCLVQLDHKKMEIFKIAHTMVNAFSKDYFASYVVACYYYYIGRYAVARKYLIASLKLNAEYIPAWLLYGHTLSKAEEHNYALSSYMKVWDLSKKRKCVISLLYAGHEAMDLCIPAAERYLEKAALLLPADPEVYNELGVAYYASKKYNLAEKNFIIALEAYNNLGCPGPVDRWEPLYTNLGHASRKLKKFENAATCFEKSLSLAPHDADLIMNLAVIYFVLGKKVRALELAEKAMSMKSSDKVISSVMEWMIKLSINDKKLFPACSSIIDRKYYFTLENENKIKHFEEVEEPY